LRTYRNKPIGNSLGFVPNPSPHPNSFALVFMLTKKETGLNFLKMKKIKEIMLELGKFNYFYHR
jgi:hypothetical protein